MLTVLSENITRDESLRIFQKALVSVSEEFLIPTKKVYTYAIQII
jgi:hypothetical protein